MRPVTAAMAALFVAACVWIYGPAFMSVLHSDVAGNVLMAAREIATRSPAPRDWYFVNGDIWVFDPHQLAVPFVAMFGPGPTALRIMLILSTLGELALLYASYLRLTTRRELAALGALATLTLWSRLSILFVYVEPTYGFFATVYLAAFVLAAPGARDRRREIATAGWLALVTLQNPQRAGVFVLAPLLVAFVWPWRARPRVLALGAATAGFAVATIAYLTLLRPSTLSSIPSGKHAFAFSSGNLRIVARGVLDMAGDSASLRIGSVPGLIVIVGAVLLVAQEVLSSREITARRFVGVAVLAQTGAVLLPLLFTNLLINERSVRYLLPSLILLIGLAALIASERGTRAAHAWLAAMPIAAVLAILRIVTAGITTPADAWADNRDAKRSLADALVRRDLKHGFATYWNANILTLLSSGKTRACSVEFGQTLVPVKWNTDASCFSDLPARFFVASAVTEHLPSLPPPVDTFTSGVFTVNVYETARMDLRWLQLPIPEATDLHFPFVLAADHPAVRRGTSVVEGTTVVATGEEGAIVFGPYIELPRGHFTIRWTGHGIDSPGAIAFDVAAAGQPQNLAQFELPSSQLPRDGGSVLATLDIDLPTTTPGLEFRVYSHDGAKVVLESATIELR